MHKYQLNLVRPLEQMMSQEYVWDKKITSSNRKAKRDSGVRLSLLLKPKTHDNSLQVTTMAF
jgi:hypothetical protein